MGYKVAFWDKKWKRCSQQNWSPSFGGSICFIIATSVYSVVSILWIMYSERVQVFGGSVNVMLVNAQITIS